MSRVRTSHEYAITSQNLPDQRHNTKIINQMFDTIVIIISKHNTAFLVPSITMGMRWRILTVTTNR